jgi:hypothetical protein
MTPTSKLDALVLIDAAVHHVWAFNPGCLAAKVQFLSAERDGVEQITEILTSHNRIQTLHIVTQGNSESVQLGSTHLTLFNLDGYGWQLQQWGEALAPDGTIVLYGYSADSAANTNFALSAPFLDRLRLLTGANIVTATHQFHSNPLLLALLSPPPAAESSHRSAATALLHLFLKQCRAAMPQ